MGLKNSIQIMKNTLFAMESICTMHVFKTAIGKVL